MKFTVEIDINDKDVKKLKQNAEHYGYDLETLLSQLLLSDYTHLQIDSADGLAARCPL